jgi:hypothetical protein
VARICSHTAPGTGIVVHTSDDGAVEAETATTPFHEPDKAIPRQ